MTHGYGSGMMNPNELRACIDAHFTKTLFRLETLPAYGVPSEGSDFSRYLAGEPGPTPERRQQWLSQLADEAARGLRRRRFHAVDLPLSDYLRFECEWSYAGNSWEEIRILELGADRPGLRRLLDDAAGDFYLADDAHLIRMYYTEAGEPLAAEADTSPASVTAYRRIADVVWSQAEPLSSGGRRTNSSTVIIGQIDSDDCAGLQAAVVS
jgi:hypothetical protein